jgi:membrane protease YdiL (CAAX protease family)
MPFSIATVTAILLYSWVLEPRGVRVEVPAAIVLVLAVWNAFQSGPRGFSAAAFVPALRAATWFTVPAVLLVVGAGASLGTLHDRGATMPSLVPLIAWGGAQQWLLQTMVLREARRLVSPWPAVVAAAALFALVHSPNPFLMVTTFAGAIGWCAIFARFPNIVPLALSHALGTLAVLYAFDDHITGRLRIGCAYLMLD